MASGSEPAGEVRDTAPRDPSRDARGVSSDAASGARPDRQGFGDCLHQPDPPIPPGRVVTRAERVFAKVDERVGHWASIDVSRSRSLGGSARVVVEARKERVLRLDARPGWGGSASRLGCGGWRLRGTHAIAAGRHGSRRTRAPRASSTTRHSARSRRGAIPQRGICGQRQSLRQRSATRAAHPPGRRAPA